MYLEFPTGAEGDNNETTSVRQQTLLSGLCVKLVQKHELFSRVKIYPFGQTLQRPPTGVTKSPKVPPVHFSISTTVLQCVVCFYSDVAQSSSYSASSCVESLSAAVQRELERDLVDQFQAQLHDHDVTN